MRIARISRHTIGEAAKLLKSGNVIVYPTDTAYALGVDPANTRAVAKVYKIKGREKKKPLPLIAASPEMAKRFFAMNKIELKLAKKHWPAPLSIMLELRIRNQESGNVHSHILKNVRMNKIVVRVPKNEIARELSRKLGRPIVSTSANISGAGEFYSAKKIYKHFENRKYKPDLVLDAGILRKRKPSTIVKVVDGRIEILRRGSIKIWKINLRLL